MNGTDEAGETALIYAAQNESVEIVRTLIRADAKVNFKGEGGWTALRYAVDQRRTDVARFLIESGATVEVADKKGETPLYWAVFKNSPELVELLLEHGADVHVKSKAGASLLNLAVSYPDALPVVKKLVRAGLDLREEPPGTIEKSMLTAAAYGQTETFEFLLDNGAALQTRTARGLSLIELLKLSSENQAGIAQVMKLLDRKGLLRDEL